MSLHYFNIHHNLKVLSGYCPSTFHWKMYLKLYCKKHDNLVCSSHSILPVFCIVVETYSKDGQTMGNLKTDVFFVFAGIPLKERSLQQRKFRLEADVR